MTKEKMTKEQFLKALFDTLSTVEYEESENETFADYIADIRGEYQLKNKVDR